MRLLETTELGKCNIIAFIDNDSKKQGSIIKGVKVYEKDFLISNEALIIICSALFSSEIEKDIKLMNIKNQILKLSN